MNNRVNNNFVFKRAILFTLLSLGLVATLPVEARFYRGDREPAADRQQDATVSNRNARRPVNRRAAVHRPSVGAAGTVAKTERDGRRDSWRSNEHNGHKRRHDGERRFSVRRHQREHHKFTNNHGRSRNIVILTGRNYDSHTHKYRHRTEKNYRQRHNRYLLSAYIPLTFAGINYYYNNGIYYRYSNYGYKPVYHRVGLTVSRLPHGYRTFIVRDYPYYYAGRHYYIHDHFRNVYVRVDDPFQYDDDAYEHTSELSEYKEIFVYPNEGQDEEQAREDKYECHVWAVEQTGFDPSLGKPGNNEDYGRAQAACLEGRGYTVN